MDYFDTDLALDAFVNDDFSFFEKFKQKEPRIVEVVLGPYGDWIVYDDGSTEFRRL